jgi:ABC-type branched-subunit amino acid transport system substrate-binding protein
VLASLPAVTGKVLGAAAQLGWAPRWILSSPSWHGALAASPLADYLAQTTWVVAEGTQWGDTTVAGVKEIVAAVATYAPDQKPDYYYTFGWVAAASVAALLEQAVAGGDLSREGILRAMDAMGPVSAGGWGEYRYGPVATREPPRMVTVFRVNATAPFGMEVEARGVSVPAAQEFQFTAK